MKFIIIIYDYFSHVFPNDSFEPESNDFLMEFKFVDSRCLVKLPFKTGTYMLPDNYLLNKPRLRNLKSRLDKNPSFLKNYNNIISDCLNETIIELVKDDDNCDETHNQPYRTVVKEERDTAKVRVVHDASVKIPG